MAIGRQTEKVSYDPELDFNDCYREKMSECIFETGQGGWKDWTSMTDLITLEKTYYLKRNLFQDYRCVNYLINKLYVF